MECNVPHSEAGELHGHVREASFAVPGHRMLYVRVHELGEQQADMVNTNGGQHAPICVRCKLLQFQAAAVNQTSPCDMSVLSSQGLA